MRNDATDGHASRHDRAGEAAPAHRAASGAIDTEYYVQHARRLRTAYLHEMLQRLWRCIARLNTARSDAASAPSDPRGQRQGQIAGRCSCHD